MNQYSFGTLSEGYASYSLLQWIRLHPGGAFVTVLILTLALAVAVWLVIRRVRAEARGYADSGRKFLGRAQERFRHPRGTWPHESHEPRYDDPDQRDVG